MQFVNLKKQYDLLKTTIDNNIQQVLNQTQFIMGQQVSELEQQLAHYVGSKHCITVGNGTDALQIAMMALNIGPGDEVITTPFTFAATGETIALLGATPVLVDIDPLTYNLDPNKLQAAISAQTKAIIPVSLYGQCADFDAINEIANQYNLPVIEDAAQSFGAIYKGRLSCNLSTLATTSFFPTKPLGCYGDGGACFTNDETLAQKIKQIRVHGQDQRYSHAIIGVNSRLDTLQAAILLAKMTVFSQEIKLRQQVAATYSKLLNGIAKTPVVATSNQSVFAQYTIEVKHRELIQEQLKRLNIPTSVHYPILLSEQRAFKALCRISGSLTHAKYAADHVMSLPMDPYLTVEEIQHVVASLSDLLAAQN